MQDPVQGTVKKFNLRGYGITFLEKEGQLTQDEYEVAHVIPGDQIRFEITRKKRAPKKGRLLEVLTASKDRVEPRCVHATTCGGCCWQQMSYEAQLKQKQERVEKAFQNRISVEPIVPCETPFGYRNKMEFSFSENRAGTRFLGLMIAQAEPYVFNVTECHLPSPWFAQVLACVRTWWETTAVKAYHPPLDTGSLRYLTLREAKRTGQKMVILNVSGNSEYALNRSQLDQFVKAVQSAFSPEEAISIFLRIHQTKKGKPTQFFEMHLAGADHIVEELHLAKGTLSFKISPISFFQPNTIQAEKLYDLALAFLGEASTVYDNRSTARMNGCSSCTPRRD